MRTFEPNDTPKPFYKPPQSPPPTVSLSMMNPRWEDGSLALARLAGVMRLADRFNTLRARTLPCVALPFLS